ncbi:MAG: FeS-binding protein [Anaerolineales bacterium]|nr:FeS-binding protein [Chloroflexota bacterium]MBL6979890.1 FeS-binding protein [Anaerolineales bacterium]
MDDQIIRLVYPPQLIDVPVINQLIRSYELTVNILRAQVTPEEGWVEIQLTGKMVEIEEAITWLVRQGIEVLRLDN